METQKQKEARIRNGGLSSNRCKCGRTWRARQILGMRGCAYHRICSGCGLKTKNCICEPI